MILSLTFHPLLVCSLQPQNRTRCAFRSTLTHRTRTHNKTSRTRKAQFGRTSFGFDFQSVARHISTVSAVATGTMPEAQQDMLFAAAMPKEEIGASEFLEVARACSRPQMANQRYAVQLGWANPSAWSFFPHTSFPTQILDVVDGTGSGDVDTSTVVEARDGVITGIYDDKLTVNPEWSNPTGKWHVGVKHLFELVPSGLKKRIKQDRRKLWDEQQALTISKAWSDLSRHCKSPKANTKAADTAQKAEGKDPATAAAAATAAEPEDADSGSEDKLKVSAKLTKEELQSRVDLLKDLTEKYEDPDFKPLTNYKTERKYGTFSAKDGCNFVCNIYEEGNVLSIVVDSGSHGTHVAGITAAHQPDNPALNGIAPGAQLISCKIGDSRLGGMETGTGLTRALITVLEHKADLINMSFGEATSTPNYGRFIELANEVVHKHGVIFVSSAGNAGPALSTVGAPGGTSSAILSIGAYVSPSMAAMAHSVRQEIAQGQQYTWSSRGPTPDGATGVVLSAPGGAIAPVPQWTEQVRQLMNGTSMSSPNACGGVALLLSAMKQHNMAISPNRVRRALENTCQPLGDNNADAVLTHGRGLLQVRKAFEYVSKSEEADKPDVRYEVTARRSDSAVTQRGIIMREPLESSKAVTYICDVHPKLHEDAEMGDKLQVYDEVVLDCTQPWLEAPNALILPHNGRMFEVKVDPVGLEEGLHYGEVQAFDHKAKWRGPLFRVPVTVIKPTSVVKGPAKAPGQVQASAPAAPSDSVKVPGMPGSIYDTEQAAYGLDATAFDVEGRAEGSQEVQIGQDFIARLGAIQFQPGTEVRRFLDVPGGATWAEMTLRAGNHDTPRNFMLRATQILPHTRYSDTEARTYVSLGAHARHVMSFKLTSAATLEITLSQFWSSLGEGNLNVEVAFHGVAVTQGSGIVAGPSRSAKVQIRAPLRTEKINPSAKLNVLQIPLRPTDSQMQPLGNDRDQLPQGRTIHALLLTYKLSVEAEGKYRVTVPMLNRYVYDGEFEGQMSMLHDTNKQLIKVSDIYPEYTDLKKGDHIIRLQLRHDDTVLLDKMKDLPVVVERKLKEPLTVPVYGTVRDAVKAAKPVKERSLYAGERVVYFLGPVPQDKLPKDAGPGCNLAGALKLGLLQGSKEHVPGAFPIFYSCGLKSKAQSDKEDADEQEPEAKLKHAEQLHSAVWEARFKFLQSVNPTESSDKLVQQEGIAEAVSRSSKTTQSSDSQDDKSGTWSGDEAEQSFHFDEVMNELLQSPPKGNADKMRVLRVILKLWSSSLPANTVGIPSSGSLNSQGSQDTEVLPIAKILHTADEVIGLVDQVALAQYMAVKSPEILERGSPNGAQAAAKQKKEMEEMKAGLIDALSRKCQALSAAVSRKHRQTPQQIETAAATDAVEPSSMQQAETETEADPAAAPRQDQGAEQEAAEARDGDNSKDEIMEMKGSGDGPLLHRDFADSVHELFKWVSAKDPKHAMMYANHEAVLGRPACAVKVLTKAMDSDDKGPSNSIELLEAKAELFKQLGWRHWHHYELSRLRLLAPKTYPLF